MDLHDAFGREKKNSDTTGQRVAIVVQNDVGNVASPTTIVVPCTDGSRDRVSYSFHVAISAGVGGLVKDSVATCEQVRTIDKERILARFGVLPPPVMAQIDAALRVALGLEPQTNPKIIRGLSPRRS